MLEMTTWIFITIISKSTATKKRMSQRRTKRRKTTRILIS